MVYKYDLHNHSDGSFDCDFKGTELIKLAKNRDLKAIGICEHDNFPDYSLLNYANQEGINLALGIEFSCIDAHIIGYNLKLLKDDEDFLKQRFKDFYQAHKEHGNELIRQLKNKGFHVCEEDILDFSGKSFVTAIDIFRYFSEFTHDFDNWQDTRKSFRERKIFDLTKKEKQHFDPYNILELIKRSDGVAIWAHPLFSKTKGKEYFSNFDPKSVYIELNYPYLENGIDLVNSNEDLYSIVILESEKRGFMYSGGSDSHYPIKKHNSGLPIRPGDFGFNSDNEPLLQRLFG